MNKDNPKYINYIIQEHLSIIIKSQKHQDNKKQ